MKYFFPVLEESNLRLQAVLLRFVAIFLFLTSLSISFAPAVRLHTWQADFPLLHWIGFVLWFVVFSIIHFLSQKQLPNLDPYLIPITGLLTGWGLLTIFRLDEMFGLRQTAWMVVAGVIFCAAIRHPEILRLMRRYKYVWLAGGLLLTGLTFFFGTYPGGEGPNLWLNFGTLYLQPSEPLKLLLIIYLAAYFADQTTAKLRSIRLMAPTMIVIAAAVLLLLAQRDLGTALIFLLIYFVVGFLASGKSMVLLLGAGLVSAAGVLGYRIFPVIQQRVTTWLNPWADPTSSSYQIVQSLIAVASGGLMGRGPGLGNPNLVPIAHSDFIFTSIAEEFGLLGSIGMMLAFALLAGRALVIAIRAPNVYRRLLAAGLAVYLSLQALFIIAGNLNLLPLSGITLPFVSYGGSSLVVCFVSAAFLAIISNQTSSDQPIQIDTDPYLVVGSLILGAWLVLSLTDGFWVVLKSDDLLNRSDNLRSSLSDLYVERGSFLDRNNTPITETMGERGDYVTRLLYPSLSPVIGYSDLYYGQAGLQASLDPYLRGLQANAASEIWSNALLYSQRPPGLNVRLSLDLELQNLSDTLLEGTRGAVVLLNAQSGEILALSTFPYFDSNSLAENYTQWTDDPNAPFFNRALQGQYQPETAMGPFFLYQAILKGNLPSIPDQLSYPVQDGVITCTQAPQSGIDWAAVISNGCPAAAAFLTHNLSQDEITSLYEQLGFFEPPSLSLPVSSAERDQSDDMLIFFDDETKNISVSPLQMALAAAALTSDGIRPDPTLLLGVQTPHQGWVMLNPGVPTTALDADTANQVVDLLSVPSSFIWQATGFGKAVEDELTTWYIAGTTSEWIGSPLAVAVLIEKEDPALAQEIGRTLLQATIYPEN